MISLSISAHVATAVLARPPVNAIDDTWVQRLNEVLDEVEAKEDVSVLHIRSGLKAFSAGADLALVSRLVPSPEGRDAMIDVIRRFQGAFARLESSRVITLAEIGGAAVGGGLELTLACDLRVAADSAKLGLPEARLGLVPGAGGTQRLSRLCGDAVARRLILGAEIVDGREAARLGLVQWTVPANELASRASALAEQLGALPGTALAACKRCIEASLDPTLDGYERELMETRRLHDVPETRERVQAFLEKSAPGKEPRKESNS